MTIFGISVQVLWLASAASLAQTKQSIPGLPGTLNWQNTPRSWNVDSKNVLTISSGEKTDWFVAVHDQVGRRRNNPE